MNELKNLPKIDKILNLEDFKDYNKAVLKQITNIQIEILRQKIKKSNDYKINHENLINSIKLAYENSLNSSIIPLINATGVIIHTNLGRSLIDEKIIQNIKEKLCSYSNLEYNLEEGKRGQRYDHAKKFITQILNCEDVIIVNNNASAVFLVLNTFSKQKESIVSRGELVEIGGSFRIPEVMKESGAILCEVGTTNKTKLSDYENAINENTKLIMKVHKSNFSIQGFMQEVDFSLITKLAKKYNLLDFYDIGSGYLGNLPYNLGKNDKSLQEVFLQNPSLVSFSGDKLLGGVQAGIIAGKKKYIDILKKNQLLRMLRVDKITLSFTEEIFKAHLLNQTNLIPTIYFLNLSQEDILKKANFLKQNIQNVSIVKTFSLVGGGVMPDKKIPSFGISFSKDAKKTQVYFRTNHIIGRIENEKFLLDLRCVKENELEKIIKVAKELKWKI